MAQASTQSACLAPVLVLVLLVLELVQLASVLAQPVLVPASHFVSSGLKMLTTGYYYYCFAFAELQLDALLLLVRLPDEPPLDGLPLDEPLRLWLLRQDALLLPYALLPLSLIHI